MLRPATRTATTKVVATGWRVAAHHARRTGANRSRCPLDPPSTSGNLAIARRPTTPPDDIPDDIARRHPRRHRPTPVPDDAAGQRASGDVGAPGELDGHAVQGRGT